MSGVEPLALPLIVTAAPVGREVLVEPYYTAPVWRGRSASGGLQYIDHPGYNMDRGPVLVRMLRAHVEF